MKKIKTKSKQKNLKNSEKKDLKSKKYWKKIGTKSKKFEKLEKNRTQNRNIEKFEKKS